MGFNSFVELPKLQKDILYTTHEMYAGLPKSCYIGDERI